MSKLMERFMNYEKKEEELVSPEEIRGLRKRVRFLEGALIGMSLSDREDLNVMLDRATDVYISLCDELGVPFGDKTKRDDLQ